LTAALAHDDFANVDIRAGTILTAVPLPNARKPANDSDIAFGPKLGIKRSSAHKTIQHHPAPPEYRKWIDVWSDAAFAADPQQFLTRF
jgi:tRNA-binding EMAP/Myf-like protein